MHQNYRTTDPVTSRLAGDRIIQSGKAEGLMRQLIKYVTSHPGHTAGEIADVFGIERSEANKRLADARRLKELVNGTDRICMVKGSMMMTWYPI